jgi:hypothetical protein
MISRRLIELLRAFDKGDEQLLDLYAMGEHRYAQAGTTWQRARHHAFSRDLASSLAKEVRAKKRAATELLRGRE